MTYMHVHAVDELRRRIGPDAEPLMHAAGAGDGIALAMLERLGHADAYRPLDDSEITAFTIEIRGQRWQGESLRIDATLPETVTQAMIGRTLGSVVSGTGHDDLDVREVSAVRGAAGHWINVDADVVDTARMRAPGLALRLRLSGAAVRGYVAGQAWAGLGNTVTDVVSLLVMTLAGMLVTLSLCMAMPNHAMAVLSTITALFVAYMARPRRTWRVHVQDHVRGHRTK